MQTHRPRLLLVLTLFCAKIVMQMPHICFLVGTKMYEISIVLFGTLNPKP